MNLSPTAPGIWPMLYAFFGEDGGLRAEAFAAQVEAAVASGCAGVAVLGLATEVGKLSPAERLAVLDAVGAALKDRLPLLATVYGDTVEEQTTFGRQAINRGAALLVLQPPPARLEEAELVGFFAAVTDEIRAAAPGVPVGVQNAPQFIGHGLSPEGIARLAERCPNFRVAKVECTAVELASLKDRLGDGVALLGGRCGLELVDDFRAGASGLVPGIETVDLQAAAALAFAKGDETQAERLYARALPTIAFLMQGVPHLLTYGKAVAAQRLGIPSGTQREPCLAPTPFGLASAARFAEALGPLPR